MEEAFGGERDAGAVEEVASDQERVHLFSYSGIDAAGERLLGSATQTFPELSRVACKDRVQVNVGYVKEAQSNNSLWPDVGTD